MGNLILFDEFIDMRKSSNDRVNISVCLWIGSRVVSVSSKASINTAILTTSCNHSTIKASDDITVIVTFELSLRRIDAIVELGNVLAMVG